MHLALKLCLGSAVLATAATPARAAADAEIAQLIQQLNDDSFAAREAATAQLLDVGFSAQEQLAAAAESPHPEVRARAQRLLVLIDQDEFQQRLAAFAAGDDVASGAGLPGWAAFREIAGDNSVARALFVQMHRTERRLLATAFGDDQESLDQEVAAGLARLGNWNQGPVQNAGRAPGNELAAGTFAAVLFVSAARADATPQQIALQLTQIAGQPQWQRVVAGRFSVPLRSMLAHWAMHSRVVASNAVQHKLRLIAIYKLREALPTALAIANGDPRFGRLHDQYRARAVLIAVSVAGEEAMAALEPLIESTAVCFHRNASNRNGKLVPATTVQLRDVVLAALVHQSGQQLRDYGFGDVEPHEQWLFKLATLGFPTEEARAAAFAKWHEQQQGPAAEG